jgi:hypothetical protein
MFHSSRLELSSGVALTDDLLTTVPTIGDSVAEGSKAESQLTGVLLECGDCAGECTSLTVPSSNQATVALGRYHVSFSRADAPADTPLITSSVVMPTVAVEHVPVYVAVETPAYGSVQCSLRVVYTVYNRTQFAQEVDVMIESSEAFMFAGHRQVHFRVLPHAMHKLQYNLVPLIPGNVHLPLMHLNLTRYPDTLPAIVHKMLPSQIFIQPRNRSSSIVQPGL